jgi:beta-N-acetylhexosaminidase
VIVREWDRHEPRPRNALVFVDQEGGGTRAFPELPPAGAPASFARPREAFAAGRAAGRALRRAGVHVTFAPVLDAAGGPLGERHFASPRVGLAFARGLRAGRLGYCVKHFPGLGTAAVSTDESPHVRARLRPHELAAFHGAVDAGAPCVMVGHAFYPRLGPRRASFSEKAYRLLRKAGFDGVAITDSVSVFGSAYAVLSARLAIGAGADLVLYTNGRPPR